MPREPWWNSRNAAVRAGAESPTEMNPANPRLDEAQIAALAEVGTRVRLRDGEALITAGVRRGGFFIVLEGAVEVIDRSGEQPRPIARHEPGQFTGDIDILARRTSLVSAFARGPTELLQVSSSDIRRIISTQPTIGDTLLRAFIARREQLLASGGGAIKLLGAASSPHAFRLRELLTRNQVPFTWVDVENDPAIAELLRHLGLKPEDLPAVTLGDRPLLRRPSPRALAEAVGLRRPARAETYDLVIVGGGPAGLAAAVYGASEGLRTLVLDSVAPGGQAGAASKIENYLGFPTGVSGAELIARATLQAQKFGTELQSATSVVGLELNASDPAVLLDDRTQVSGRSVLIATGADYRKLTVPGRERFDGVGVYYAATPIEVTACRGADVIVVGGGNSAGQGAMFLSRHTTRVWLLLRGSDLRANMSSYLADRIEHAGNIEVLRQTEIRQFIGDERLLGVQIEHIPTGRTRRIDAQGVFSFIGATPRTQWLAGRIQTNANGFVLTGRDVIRRGDDPPSSEAFLLETSHPGVFAAGDVRHGSVKRVASAVGEGAMAIMFVHQHLRRDDL